MQAPPSPSLLAVFLCVIIIAFGREAISLNLRTSNINLPKKLGQNEVKMNLHPHYRRPSAATKSATTEGKWLVIKRLEKFPTFLCSLSEITF